MELGLIANQNPWWDNKDAIAKDEKVKRVIAAGEKLVIALEDKNLVMIGPRQLGKTTALKYDIYKKIMKEEINPKQILYYSFDTARDFEAISDTINTFISSGEGKRYLYLDEVSFVKEWQRAIKFFLDSNEARNTRVYITGSSSINLKKELFPGREIQVREFLPSDFREFAMALGSEQLSVFLAKNGSASIRDAVNASQRALPYFKELSKLFKMFIQTGGYPLAVFDYRSGSALSETTVETHWNAFLSDVSKADKSVETATALIREVLKSYSSKANMSKIAREAGVLSHVTAREYVELFRELFILDYIFPINRASTPLFRKERKIYLKDPFLFNMFAKKLNVEIADEESKVVEGIVCSHLERVFKKVGYLQNEKEVDFVANDAAIEVKWQTKADERDIPKTDLRDNVLLGKDELNKSIIPVAVFLSLLGKAGT